jgi:tyrosyl-tRNA synthetase
MVDMTTDERMARAQALLERRVQQVFPSVPEAAQRLASGDRMTIYLGIDPTGPDIHMGHLVPLLVLRDCAALGHDAVLLIGDFTARIGDPTGKQSARVALTPEEVAANLAAYVAQATTIFGGQPFRIAHNSEWLASMTLEDVVRLAGKFTVQQMLARDMFQERMKQEQPVYVHEFLYPLMQGYDSVALRTDAEIGGNDQMFNMLVGRELSRELLGKDKLVLATHLLVDAASGRKMSKSEGTLIALSDPGHEIRRKVLAMDDGMIATAFRLCTDKPLAWIAQREAEIAAGQSPRTFKEELAVELATMFHGAGASENVQEAQEISQTGPIDRALKGAGIVASLSEAKRLVQQGAVQVNDTVIDRWDHEITRGDRIKLGKGRFIRVS